MLESPPSATLLQEVMSTFEYVMIPPAIVLGLALAHVLSGAGRIVHRLAGHGSPIRLDWIHLFWVAHIFNWIVIYWWYSFTRIVDSEWSLLVFMFIIFYTVGLYLLCVVLIPSDLDKVSDFAEYFMSLRSWFFAGIILLILVDFADSAVKGLDNLKELGLGYFSHMIFKLLGGIFAMLSQSRWYHSVFAIISFVWMFLFFWLNRPFIGGG